MRFSRMSRIALALCAVTLLCGVAFADQLASQEMIEPEYNDDSAASVETAPVDNELFKSWQNEQQKDADSEHDKGADDLKNYEEVHDMGVDMPEYSGDASNEELVDGHDDPSAVETASALKEGDSALSELQAEKEQVNEPANSAAMEEENMEDEQDSDDLDQVESDKLLDSTVQKFNDDDDADREDEADKEFRQSPRSSRSKKVTTRKGRSRRRRTSPKKKARKAKLRRLARKLRKYLKRKNAKKGGSVKNASARARAHRFQALITSDQRPEMRQLWAEVRTIKARVRFLRERLAQGPKKPNPTPSDVAAFQTRVAAKIETARGALAPVLLKIRELLLKFHDAEVKSIVGSQTAPVMSTAQALTEFQRANPHLYAASVANQATAHYYAKASRSDRQNEDAQNSQRIKDHLAAFNGVLPGGKPRWQEQAVKTPEQQKIWDEAVKREQNEIAARINATRDAHAYNAALRWTGQRFNDTVLKPLKFPNISDPTVRHLPPADPNSPLSRAFWNNVKEQPGKGKRTLLTENQPDSTDPKEQAFLQRVAQTEGVWDYRVGGLDWSMGECGVGHAQSPMPLRHGAQNLSVVHYTTEGRPYALNMQYVAADRFSLINDGHTLRIVATKNGSMSNLGFVFNNGSRYIVKAVEFHTPSEHAFEANNQNQRGRYPIEMMIIHQKEGSNGTENLLIVSVMFHVKRTPGVNKFLHNIDWNKAPKLAGYRQRINGPIDLKDLQYSFDGEYFHYVGSMTRPPCAENVAWYVMATPQGITEWEYNVIKNIFVDRLSFSGGKGNARALQPRNSRNVVLVRRHNFEPLKKPTPAESNIIDGMDKVPKRYVFPKVCKKGESC